MTIVKFEIELFSISRSEAADVVNKVLTTYPEYKDPERPEDDIFRVLVKPSFALDATRMKIDLYEHPDGTVVRVETRSKPWVRGDMTGYFDRVLRAFLARFREKILLDDRT